MEDGRQPAGRDGGSVAAGTPLWEPPPRRISQAAVTNYRAWLAAERGVELADDTRLWEWSVTDLDTFWESIWDFCAVEGDRGTGPALADAAMPGAVWFPGARVNYAENALTRRGPAPAVIAVREDGATAVVSWDELRRQVAKAAAGLRSLGVAEGDRVCAVLPNTVYAMVGMLATASIGAVWSSCSPELGPTALRARFGQIDPKVLIGVDGYSYGGKSYDALDTLAALAGDLPGLGASVIVPYLWPDALSRARAAGLPGLLTWDELMASETSEPEFTRVAFDAPLWILYSSGTTGPPKAIVHGHGGILLEHLKSLALHLDLGPDDRFCWFTTTGWMMWNYLVSGLLVGATVVLYDGAPGYPALGTLFGLAEALELTCLGTSVGYLQACEDAGLVPREFADLSRLRTVGSTGSPLSAAGYAWVYEAVSPTVMLSSISGGTDVCTALVAGLPTMPVRAGEIGSRALGCAVRVFDEAGEEVVDEVGELVVTAPMPSMPLCFWADPDGGRLRESYFSVYPGVWRHGDWARITPTGAVVIQGRSDATLNRGGVRIGTSELYSVVERVPGIADSLAVDTADERGHGELLLFVVLTEPGLTEAVAARLREVLRAELSPRHVPDRIIEITEVPRTHTGKKLEVPVKRLLAGTALDEAVSLDSVANPDALLPFAAASARSRRSASEPMTGSALEPGTGSDGEAEPGA
ncbi:acyl-CoA synthetase/AMP-acid ligase [Frankia casuarinae]|nr:acetoacetate--CoA ligase [Frankia casuarinae]EYT92706.1 acyl-CoA synthetase/AMP-acid ligase [Frankia casuarinae]KDA43641.1 acyl-CoA synthetase/AMP-acid ligase [Frankia sp. BMG5.23]TFE27307.1 acetoacetate--CoA ligase [Frankia sp. B2]